MQLRIRIHLAAALTIAMILLAGLLYGPPAIQHLQAAEGDTNLINLVLSGDLTVGDDATFSNDITVSGDLVTTGDVTTTGSASIGDILNLGKQPVVVVTQDGTITPSGTYQPISSTGSVATNSIADGKPGDLLILTNVANTTITLSDTGTLKLSSNAALGQFDSIILLFDGTNWLEIAAEGNS